MSVNIKICVEYDGRAFCGWQRQSPHDGPTVQGTLESALSRVCNHPVVIHGSGRTDAGVHARGQCANFQCHSGRSPLQIIKGCNCLLPPQLAILKAEETSEQFHARFSAIGKVYDYDFCVSPTRRPLLYGRAWMLGPGLDWDEIALALKHLEGEHDFACFQSVGSDVETSVRTIFKASLSQPDEELIRITLKGSGFLRHMVRAIAGTMCEVGRGKIKASDIPDIIKSRSRNDAGPTAPPDGLYLKEVLY